MPELRITGEISFGNVITIVLFFAWVVKQSNRFALMEDKVNAMWKWFLDGLKKGRTHV
jgi:hypothetical protein